MMRINLKSISLFAVMLMVLCIIPSGTFASENNAPGQICPADNITEENFTNTQANILDSISERIAELQSFYTNVSEASNASDLQEVLSSHRPECRGHDGMNMECRGPDEMNIGSCETHMGPGGMQGLFDLDMVENVTDENFTDVQTEIVASLGNMTTMLETKQTNLTEAGEDERAAELGERISDLQNLSTDVSAASTATELQEVVFTYMQTRAVSSLEKEIEHLEAKVSESENTSDSNMSDELNSRITEISAMIEDVNGAESLAALKEIMSSSRGMPGMESGMGSRECPMHHGGYGGCDCPIDFPDQDNSTDNSTDNNTDNSTE
jgi:hypothetical protein